MSGVTKTHVQLGDSSTATNNFMLTAQAADGTMKLARGNNGATTQDIMTVNAAGKVEFPQNVIPAFRGFVIAASHPNASVITPAIGQDYDLGGDFLNPTISKYQPTVAGYYQINAYISFAGLTVNGYIRLDKNGTNTLGGTQGNFYQGQANAFVYLNGSTDFVQLYTYQSSGAALNCNIEFTGFLARAA